MSGRVLETAGRGEDAGQRVVVLGQDRVELVVVAASASDRQAQHALGHDFDLLVVHVVEHALLVLLRDGLRAERQEAGGDDAALVDLAAIAAGQQIAGDLFPHELVVGHVAVECLDDVVAVLPSVRIAVILVVAGRVRIAGNVQPMAAPALAVRRRCEQALHHALVSSRGSILEERLRLCRSRRQSRQVECRPAQPSQLVGRRVGLQAVLLHLGQHEAVDRILVPGGIVHCWRIAMNHRLERPVVLLLVGEDALLALRDHGLVLFCPGPWSAPQDPVAQDRQLVVGKLAAGRHLDASLVADDREQAAGLRILRRDQRSLVAGLQEALHVRKVDVAALQLSVVADLALRDQQRAHMLLEMLKRFRLCASYGQAGQQRNQTRSDGGLRVRGATVQHSRIHLRTAQTDNSEVSISAALPE